MIRWLILPALALAIGGLVAANLRDDPGYVLIQIAGYTLESSLTGLILIGLVVIALISLAGRLIAKSVRLPGQVSELVQERRLEQARKQLHLGLKQLAAGQFDKAEAELLKRISQSEDPGANYLYAAEAAHRQNNPQRRDEYLALADQADDSNHAAVLLRRAQMWADDGRHSEALDAVDSLLAAQPRHAGAMTLRLSLLQQLNRFEDLKAALPAARNVVDAELIQSCARHAHTALLSQARASGRVDTLRDAWQDVDKSLQHDPELIAHYARLCHDLNIDVDGLRLIVAELRHHWHAELALVYGELDGGDVVRQLAKVEEWIKQHGEKAELLIIAGRLCLRNRLWGRARSYFEACLRSYPSPEIRLELGKLLIQQGEDETAALELFREGLESSLSPKGIASPSAELLPKERSPS